jgi:hypothetical protein
MRSTGRLFFYVMGQPDESKVTGDRTEAPRRASLTISEAAIDGTCGFPASKVDAEDPRCTKLSISGMFKQVSADDVSIPLPVDFLYLMVSSCTLIIRKKVNAVVPYVPNISILNSVQLKQTRCDNLTWKLFSYSRVSYHCQRYVPD